MEVVTLWLAVDRADQENGCMRVIPRTHKDQLFEMQDASDKGAVLDRETPPEFVDESKAVDIVLDPGDVEVHHPNIIHGSHANASPRRRCGLTIRYIPTSTRVISDHDWPSLFLLRGEPGTVNSYRPRPKYVEGESFPFKGSENWR
jgi:ectoine hydroxylase-related dioxygenase (phytanoyl-CoA dioxygenase family)